MSDVEKLAAEFVRSFDLRFTQETPTLSSPLMRWLDFRRRYVDPRPRHVIFSDKFPIKDLPRESNNGLKELVQRFKQGGNVNPYQGRGLILRNDTSCATRHARTDLLFADWGILHFHLTSKPITNGRFFSVSGDYLAFCLVGEDVVCFLEVRPHPERVGFANLDLFNTLARNCPEFIEQFRIKGLIAPDKAPTTEEVSQLRESGITSFYNFNGALYAPPGGGVTTASTPMQLTLDCDSVLRSVRSLAAFVDDPEGQFRTHSTIATVSQPEFRLGFGSGSLLIVETVSKTHFTLPKAVPNARLSWIQILNNNFAPYWTEKHSGRHLRGMSHIY